MPTQTPESKRPKPRAVIIYIDPFTQIESRLVLHADGSRFEVEQRAADSLGEMGWRTPRNGGYATPDSIAATFLLHILANGTLPSRMAADGAVPIYDMRSVTITRDG